MTYRLIKRDSIKARNHGIIQVKNRFNQKKITTLSIAEVCLNGKQKYGLNTKSDLYYYVLKGKGSFWVEGKKINVRAGDLMCISKRTKYKDEGKMTLLAIATPRYNPAKRILEED